MDNLVEQLVAMKIEEKTDYRSILPLGKGIGYFAMSEKTLKLNDEINAFLKKLESKYYGKEKVSELNSSRYFFGLGGKTILEIATIVVRNEVTIIPYVLYFDDDIRVGVQRNITREHKIYQIFKCVGLQK